VTVTGIPPDVFPSNSPDPAIWGAGPPGSPVLGVKSTLDRLTLFLIPIGQWSDGTAAAVDEH
jgi:hypothetical protein